MTIHINIVCVADDTTVTCTELYKTLCKISTKNGYTIEVRPFNSWIYECDREEITSLPAFHIFINSQHYTTIFQNDTPIEKIEAAVREYEESKTNWIQKLVSYIL